jgi:CRISPR-associated protein Csm5
MSRDRHWQLAITPLSPVHLGSGQDYEPTGYVIDDGALFEFDGLAALSALPELERAKLGKILDGAPTQVMLRQVQGFFYSNRDRLIAASRRVVRVNPSVEAFYRDRIGQVAQRETGGREVQNRLEIERTAYNPVNGAPILAGSGLKGAIRTALLDGENRGNSLRQVEDRRRGGTRNENNQELQQRLFLYQAGKFELDPMRLVRLADAAPVAPDALATQVHFAVNRKKQPVTVGGRLVDSQAEQRGLYQLLECLPPFQAQAFRSQLSIQDTGGVESRHWPDSTLRFDLQAIVAACNQFYRPILEQETQLLRERGFLNEGWDESLQRLLQGPSGDALESNRAFLLRVGRHSGAESVTLNGVRDIKIMKGQGERPERLPAAKTLWLAAEEPGQQHGLLPFGWLLIEPYQESERPSDLELSSFGRDLADWRRRVDARITQARADLSQAQEHELQVQREQEVAEREAAERAARLERLSPEGRKLEALRALLARDRAQGNKQPGGELAGNLVGLLKEAAQDWPPSECHDLADLAEQVYAFIGWPKSKKKQERQAQISALRMKGR